MLQTQIDSAKQEREALDARLPRGGGPIVSRLDAAERELALLEELVPLDTRCTAARHEAEAAAARVATAETDLSTARRRWRDTLVAAGLPGNLAPKHVKHLAQRCERITELQRRLARRREEFERRRGELDGVTERADRLVADTGLTIAGDDLLQDLVHCLRARDAGNHALQDL